jgi:hypothetical protein
MDRIKLLETLGREREFGLRLRLRLFLRRRREGQAIETSRIADNFSDGQMDREVCKVPRKGATCALAWQGSCVT